MNVLMVIKFSLAKEKAKEIIKWHGFKDKSKEIIEAQLRNHETFAMCDFMDNFSIIDKKIQEVKTRFYGSNLYNQ